MMKVIKIDDYISLIKAIAQTRHYERMLYIEEARAIHKNHTKAHIQEIIDEAQKMSNQEISGMIAVGLRQPALREVTRMMVQRELKARQHFPD